MNFKITQKLSRAVSLFLTREWEVANINRFGWNVPWVEKDERIIAKENGEIVGYLHYVYKGGVMEIAELIVDHKRYRQGIGAALMKKAESIALNLGAHKLYVLTGMGDGAVKFYKSNGFIKTGSIKNHYRKVEMIELAKHLTLK